MKKKTVTQPHRAYLAILISALLITPTYVTAIEHSEEVNNLLNDSSRNQIIFSGDSDSTIYPSIHNELRPTAKNNNVLHIINTDDFTVNKAYGAFCIDTTVCINNTVVMDNGIIEEELYGSFILYAGANGYAQGTVYLYGGLIKEDLTAA